MDRNNPGHGWKSMDTCPAAAEKKDARTVIVWHIFQGAMVYSTMHAHDNRFNAYWQEPPDRWIDPHDRLPTQKDADPKSCILIIDKYGEIKTRGWHQVEKPEDVRAWAPRPEPPDNYRELRAEAL